MTTTLSTQFKRGNYCTLPTIDVEIIPSSDRTPHCATCGGDLVDTNAGDVWAWPEYTHAVEPDVKHYISRRATCQYCGSDEHTTSHQRSWSDELDCSRCGGTTGFAIGD